MNDEGSVPVKRQVRRVTDKGWVSMDKMDQIIKLEQHLRDARSCHEAKLNECKKLRKILADWQVFAADVQAGDAAGMDWLDDLKSRTQRALNA